MKITVFIPHPDDEVFGCGGSILKWLSEGHKVHLIYVTDNRALLTFRFKDESVDMEAIKPYLGLSDDEIAEISLDEAIAASEMFGVPNKNTHLFKIHDQRVMQYISHGISLAEPIAENSDRIILPTNNNNHVDHQATHLIAKGVAKKLNLLKTQYYVYGIYNRLKVERERLVKIKILEYRDKLYDILSLYKTQLCFNDTRLGWETIRRKPIERFAVFSYEEMDKFYNF